MCKFEISKSCTPYKLSLIPCYKPHIFMILVCYIVHAIGATKTIKVHTFNNAHNRYANDEYSTQLSMQSNRDDLGMEQVIRLSP